jgi:hypothetical protein
VTDERERDDDPTTAGESATDPAAEPDPTDGAAASLDEAARSFLDVEADLAGETAAGTARARAVGVERVSAGAVPPEYPWTVTTAEALALDLELRTGDRTTAYFEFDGEPGDRLRRLLAVQGVAPERFGDLHGRSLLVRRREGHWLPVVPDAAPRGSERGLYGLWAGLGAATLAALLTTVGLGTAALALVALATLLLAVGTYRDAWHRRTHTDWDGGPLFWTALALLPGPNVLTAVLYLRSRGRATPLAGD